MFLLFKFGVFLKKIAHQRKNNLAIDNNVKCEWKIKILHGADRITPCPITIGIASSSFSNSEILGGDKDNFYGFSLDGRLHDQNGSKKYIKMEKFHNGDILNLILHVTNRTLICETRNKSYCIAKNIVMTNEIKYRLAVSMSRCDDSVELIEL